MSAPSSSAVRGPTKSESLVGVLSGGGRAIASQFFSFYIRVPVKLFKPARVDYSLLLRHSVDKPLGPPNYWANSNLGMLYRAIRTHGFRFLPDKLLPPIIANSAVGAVLYTAYLSALTVMQFASGNEHTTFKQAVAAGGIAGAAQAVVATPLDNLATRFNTDILRNPSLSLWTYSRDTLWNIGPRAAYGGIILNLVKESTSFAVFFGVYETIKGPWFRSYRDWWQSPGYFHPEGRKRSRILYPSFVLLAGCAAACTIQFINYPLSKVQRLFSIRLQAIDATHKKQSSHGLTNLVDQGWRLYAQAYYKTYEQIKKMSANEAGGSLLRWLYSGISRYTLVSMPSTSIGLLVFEIMRIRYAPIE